MKKKIISVFACLFSILFLVYIFRLSEDISNSRTKLLQSPDVVDVTDSISTEAYVSEESLPGLDWTRSGFESSGWQEMKLPGAVKDSKSHTPGNFVYYRILVPASLQAPLSHFENQLALGLHYVGYSKTEIYVNGKLWRANTPSTNEQTMTVVPLEHGVDNLVAIKGLIGPGDIGIEHRERIIIGKSAALNELYVLTYKGGTVFSQIFILSKGSVLFLFTLIFLFISVSGFFDKFLVFGLCVLAEDFITGETLSKFLNLNQLTFLFTVANIGAVIFLFLFLLDVSGRKVERSKIIAGCILLIVTGSLVSIDVLYTRYALTFTELLKFWNLAVSLVLLTMVPFFFRKNKILFTGMSISLALTLWSTFFASNVGINYKAFGNLILFFSVACETFLLLRKEQDLLREKEKQLLEQEKDVAIGRTAALLAHDVRRPLEQMKMVLERISSGKSTPEFLAAAQRDVEFSLTSVNTQVNDIMNFSSVRSLELSPVSFYRLLSASLKQVMTINQNVELDLHYDLKAQVKVMGDESLLAGVLTNLISNALEAVRDIGKMKHGNISFATSIEDGQFIFTITNDGPPIPENMLEEIWKPLVTRGKNRGTGLGLASVTRAVKEHQGSVSASNSSSGVTFTVKLIAAEETDVLSPGDLKKTSADYGHQLKTSSSVSTEKLRVFILDDDIQVFDYFRFLAGSVPQEIELTYAGSYSEGERIVASRRFDLYFLDYDLGSSRTGAEFFEQYLPSLTKEVILHTNREETQLSGSHCRILPKPMPAENFVELLTEVTQERKKILLVDDSELVREAWAVYHGSHNVLTVDSPERALKALEDEKDIRICVLDYYFDNSPMNGLELGRLIRKTHPEMKIYLSSNVPVKTDEFTVVDKARFEVRV